MDLSKNTIIGIHAGSSIFECNKGYFIKNPIIEFIQNESKNKLDNNITNIINNDKDIKSSKNILNNNQKNEINNKYKNKKNLNPINKFIQKEDKSKSDNKVIDKINNDKNFKSNENKSYIKDKELERFLEDQIRLIREYYELEKMFDEYLGDMLNQPTQIYILNKEWIKKWKEIIGYEQIKEKCKKYLNNQYDDNLKNEIYDFLIKNNSKEKMEKLGKMNFSNFNKGKTYIENGNKILFNETMNFIPMPLCFCNYMKNYIKDNIRVIGNFNNNLSS